MLYNSLSKWLSLLFICAANVATQDINITIPLNKTTIYRDKQMYGEFVTLNRSSQLQVNFDQIKSTLAFIIFQVHSHLYNITLYKNVKEEGTFVTGTNIGLHSEYKYMKSDKFFVQNLNENVDLKLYVAVHGYFGTDPIPGGCNMEFPVRYPAPFMRAIHNRNYIYIDIAPAQYQDPDCILSDIRYIQLKFYMLYLPEHNYDADVYFEGIMSMMSLKKLKDKRVIPLTLWNTRRMTSAYTGTGVVYVAVANKMVKGVVDEDSYSLYVPTTSYGCSPVSSDCDLLEDTFSQISCALLFFIGVFICYYGHRFFKTHTFLIGFLSGLVVTYILVCLLKKDLDRPATLAISALSGICIGASRLVYWWIYGLPVFSIILSSADVGFLLSSVLFYAIPDELSQQFYLNIDLNFWALFVLCITLITIILLTINNIANFICSAVIGGYAVILPIDYYLGSQMKYSLINIFRRATVPNYFRAVQMATFQWKDWTLAILWLVLSVTGFLYQRHQNEGRPPFPPPPRSVRAMSEYPAPVAEPSGSRKSLNNSGPSRPYNEKTPLLA